MALQEEHKCIQNWVSPELLGTRYWKSSLLTIKYSTFESPMCDKFDFRAVSPPLFQFESFKLEMTLALSSINNSFVNYSLSLLNYHGNYFETLISRLCDDFFFISKLLNGLIWSPFSFSLYGSQFSCWCSVENLCMIDDQTEFDRYSENSTFSPLFTFTSALYSVKVLMKTVF